MADLVACGQLNERSTREVSRCISHHGTLAPGRKHYRDGEVFAYDLFSATITAACPDGSALFTEKLLIEPARYDVRSPGVMGGFDVFANVVLLTPPDCADRVVKQTQSTIDHTNGWAAGVSRLPNEAGLIYKVLGKESEQVRDIVRGRRCAIILFG